MKNLILILITSLSLSCCSKDENKTPLEQLPAATQTGANTAGCLVDGQVLLPRGQKIQNGPVLSSFYQKLNGKYYFGLGIDDNSGNNLKGIGINSDNITLEVNKLYILGEDLNDDTQIYIFGYFINYDIGFFKTTKLITGELKITHLDTTNFIISGTFWFDAVGANGNIVKVTDGRFDLHYAP